VVHGVAHSSRIQAVRKRRASSAACRLVVDAKLQKLVVHCAEAQHAVARGCAAVGNDRERGALKAFPSGGILDDEIVLPLDRSAHACWT